LVISERMVENHVSSILAKYGAASRADLIAKLRADPKA
jgi:DNA-binding CsgD family transcriptional regulator